MFGIKSKKIKELEKKLKAETEAKNDLASEITVLNDEIFELRETNTLVATEIQSLKSKWELPEELHGVDTHLQGLTRGELIREAIKTEDCKHQLRILMQRQDNEAQLRKENSDLKSEIESLKSKLTRKKPIKKSAQ